MHYTVTGFFTLALTRTYANTSSAGITASVCVLTLTRSSYTLHVTTYCESTTRSHTTNHCATSRHEPHSGYFAPPSVRWMK